MGDIFRAFDQSHQKNSSPLRGSMTFDPKCGAAISHRFQRKRMFLLSKPRVLPWAKLSNAFGVSMQQRPDRDLLGSDGQGQLEHFNSVNAIGRTYHPFPVPCFRRSCSPADH
jgi:hypothetical protein